MGTLLREVTPFSNLSFNHRRPASGFPQRRECRRLGWLSLLLYSGTIRGLSRLRCVRVDRRHAFCSLVVRMSYSENEQRRQREDNGDEHVEPKHAQLEPVVIEQCIGHALASVHTGYRLYLKYGMT